MVTFLVRTGVRVSEMLSLKLTDLGTAKDGLGPRADHGQRRARKERST